MTLTELKAELIEVNSKINKLTPRDSHIDNLPFHLGMVGGSGKNVRLLNKRRERYLDKTIEAAKQLTPLYSRKEHLEQLIKDTESGELERRIKAQAENKARIIAAKVDYWNGLKVGDEIMFYTGNTATITKKNKKSCETGTGCKWTAEEIIGKEAAKLI